MLSAYMSSDINNNNNSLLTNLALSGKYINSDSIKDIAKKIIIDTSSIVFGISLKLDVFGIVAEALPDHEIAIASGTIRELERLKTSGKKNSKDAAASIFLIQSNHILQEKSEGNVDDWIVRYAERTGAKVCTNDTELRKRLRSKGLVAVTLSQNRTLR